MFNDKQAQKKLHANASEGEREKKKMLAPFCVRALHDGNLSLVEITNLNIFTR